MLGETERGMLRLTFATQEGRRALQEVSNLLQLALSATSEAGLGSMGAFTARGRRLGKKITLVLHPALIFTSTGARAADAFINETSQVRNSILVMQ